MKKISMDLLADTVIRQRKAKHLTQKQLSDLTGINRTMISRLEKKDYQPSIQQLETLGEVLDFEPVDLFIAEKELCTAKSHKPMNIAVAGTGYVGLSIATLLAQHNHVTAVDIIPEKVDMINNRKCPIQDDYIEKYLEEVKLDLSATTDAEKAYRDAEIIVIATPTNYDDKQNYFDTSAVEAVLDIIKKVNPDALVVIKSTIPVGYTRAIKEKKGLANILFSPELWI